MVRHIGSGVHSENGTVFGFFCLHRGAGCEGLRFFYFQVRRNNDLGGAWLYDMKEEPVAVAGSGAPRLFGKWAAFSPIDGFAVSRRTMQRTR